MKKKFLVILSVLTFSLTLISCNQKIETPNIEFESSKTDTIDPKPNSSDNDNNTNTTNTTEEKDTDPNTSTVKKENKSVRLYFYNFENDTIVYYDDTIEVTDKAVTNALINALKHPSKASVTPIIPESINISSAKLDKENNLFTVDFTPNFVSEMNLGSGSESKVLKAIVNTIGYNYEVDNVMITLGGKPYSSGHILMSEGESFKVSLEDAIKL